MISQTFKPDQTSGGFDLDASIDFVSNWLPIQGPIKDFVHHNILHAFQHLPFHDGLAVAGKLFGARSYLPMDDYQALYRQGRIKDFALDWALRQTGCDPERQQAIRATLFESDKHSHFPPLSLANHGLRNAWLTRLEIDLNALVHPIIFRLLSSFLDQGISRWTMPRNGERFWESVLRLTQNSLLPLYPFHEPAVAGMLKDSLDDIIVKCLQKIVGDERHYRQYLLELLLSHPGWSGMVRVIEQNPQSLLVKRAISIKELLAVELMCELAIVSHRRPAGFPAIADLPDLDSLQLLDEKLLQPKVPLKFRVWHEAMEWALYTELLMAIRDDRDAAAERARAGGRPAMQGLFCIDDRECSIRRNLEEVNPGIETFGAAGFFGVDFFYKGLDDAYPVAQCPVVITPRHLVLESRDEPQADNQGRKLDFDKMHYTSHSMFRGWLYTQTLGLGYAVRMAWEVFRPTGKLPNIRTLSEISDAHTHLHLLRESDEPNADGHLLGFSLEEMADRVGGLLRNIGLTDYFAPLVVVVAHGSSSVNNPHFAAYDCGACSGKPGAPNARAFASMANHPGVRGILRERGIDIPDATCFLAAMHNTSCDEIVYFDEHDLVNPPLPLLQRFKADIETALERNAHERCRWFELAPQSGGHAASHQHVKSRASSIFEPRPEYDHSNNLYCIVGRRDLSRNLFMDRRSFLHSYQPDTDPHGEILSRILAAIFPVCGGISLQYMFSRLDNSVYGSGTKLPHNVIGLLGVANGVEGDLRTGLTQQMIEVHEPARLLLVIEQAPAVIDQAIARLPGLKDWPENEWVRMAACLPETRDMFLYAGGGWLPVELPADLASPRGADSQHIYTGRDRTIPVHRLTGSMS